MNHATTGYVDNIEQQTLDNSDYRHVLYTAKNMQLVAMCLKPSEEIGMEVHVGHDQFFRIEQGNATAIVNGETYNLGPDQVLIVPAGAEHNVINSSTETELKLYTIYAPPVHPEGTVQHEKPAND